jgi:hypothetical protein
MSGTSTTSFSTSTTMSGTSTTSFSTSTSFPPQETPPAAESLFKMIHLTRINHKPVVVNAEVVAFV